MLLQRFTSRFITKPSSFLTTLRPSRSCCLLVPSCSAGVSNSLMPLLQTHWIHSSHSSTRRYPNPKLRTHAISLLDGDYSDYESEDETEEAFPHSSNYDYYDTELDTLDPEELDQDVKLRNQLEAEALEIAKQEEAQKAKWAENAKPPVRVPQIDAFGRAYGRGGRKTATARVWIMPGEGHVTINRRPFVDFFPRETDRELVLSPFVATNTCGKFDVVVHVEGGGVTGKAGAVRHGVSRALEKYCPDYRPPLKRLGFMTRDARMVEEKKIGLKKARKAPQWVRR